MEEERKKVRQVGLRRHVTATTTMTTTAVAAVGRKFKIEYLASNFHRSSKNRAVSYLAGGRTPGCSPPRSSPSSPVPLPPTTIEDRGKTVKRETTKSSPLHTLVSIVPRDRLCSDYGNTRTRAHVCAHEYLCGAAHRSRRRACGAKEFDDDNSPASTFSEYFSAFPDRERALTCRITDVGGLGERSTRRGEGGSFPYISYVIANRAERAYARWTSSRRGIFLLTREIR